MFDFIERHAVKAAIAIVLIAFWVALQVFAVHAVTRPDRAVYELQKTRSGNQPQQIVVIGAFGYAEDMTQLRLVSWDPKNDRVVYRVVTP